MAMQKLAHLIGFAYYDSTSHLCLHPKFGPWFSMRAVIVFEGLSYTCKHPDTFSQETTCCRLQVLYNSGAGTFCMTAPDLNCQCSLMCHLPVASKRDQILHSPTCPACTSQLDVSKH